MGSCTMSSVALLVVLALASTQKCVYAWDNQVIRKRWAAEVLLLKAGVGLVLGRWAIHAGCLHSLR